MIYALIPLMIIVFILISFLLFLTLTEFKPGLIEDAIKLKNSRDCDLEEIKSITTFNLGYCSLDKDQDFFLEGGSNSKAISKEQTFDNLLALTSILQEIDSDFFLLQEVDTKGTRSANVNQVENITSELKEHNAFYAYNYRAKWVPLPVTNPMGSAYSGILTLSKKPVISSKRVSLNGQEKYPKSMFYPKRCMTVTEIQIKRSKKLYIINIHLSAYDKDGQYRSKQIEHIIEYISNLYNQKENYIIVGGDFNHLLDKKAYTNDMPKWVSVLPNVVYDSEFRVVFDKTINTVRSQEQPYKKGENFETIIDGFLISPNISVSNITTHDFGYRYTDHNPVTMTFKLK